MRLITNNLDKVTAMAEAGIQVVERTPCEAQPDPYSLKYLQTKKQKLGLLLSSL